jgi:hypothetical protein
MLKKYIPILIVISTVMVGKVTEKKQNFYKYQSDELHNQLKNKKISFSFSEDAKLRGIHHKHELFTPHRLRKSYSKLLPYNASVAVSDVNNDGFPDLFFSNSKEGATNYFYLNDGHGNFIESTEMWGLAVEKNLEGETMGGVFFDYDNDGFVDLLLVKSGCHRLFKNTGNTFKDVSTDTNLSAHCTYASAASIFDFNNDGFLDIYISNSLNAGSEKIVSGRNLGIIEPRRNKHQLEIFRQDILLKNMNGKFFQDVTKELGVEENELTWAAGISDFNRDGWPDIFIANDFNINRLLLNQNATSFADATKNLGHQFYSGNMSATIGDYNNDGFSDIFVSNLSRSTYYVRMMNWLFQGDGHGYFKNVSFEKGVDRCSWAWGSNFADFDKDGLLDLFVATGLFNDGKKPYIYKLETFYVVPQLMITDPTGVPPTEGSEVAGNDRPCLFIQNNDKFVDIADSVGLSSPTVGRGSAVVDVDNNGTLDLVIASHNSTPKLYINHESGQAAPWIGFKLVGMESNKNAIGAKITIFHPDSKIQFREIFPTNGFSSQSDIRVFFGLGQSSIERVEIKWPSGNHQILLKFDINAYNTIVEGQTTTGNAKND